MVPQQTASSAATLETTAKPVPASTAWINPVRVTNLDHHIQAGAVWVIQGKPGAMKGFFVRCPCAGALLAADEVLAAQIIQGNSFVIG